MAKIPPGLKEIMVNGVLVGHFESTGDTEKDLPLFRAKLKELGHSVKEYPQWMHIRQQAIYFQDTCAYLLQSEIARPAPRRPFALIPYVVNTAFCIELYLKALALKHGIELRGHKLLSLYEALPPTALADIEASVEEALQAAPVGEPPEVAAYMSHLSNAFVEWRYAYEKEHVGEVRMDVMRFLRMLMFLACRNEISETNASP